ncbi:MAG TPA: uroporphyrinogen decarboxylase family protein [Candidatus Limnocylindrales bacterium]|nr:uroporphyrinogen decarboxylase family protein [Candidatus Limnocylindrales bacterium]
MKIDLRACVKGILQGTLPPRPLFLPIVFSHAARIENLPLPAFLSNPTKIMQSLRQLRSYLRSDGVTCYFDPFLEAEALGAILQWGSGAQPSIRWPHDPLNGDLPAADEIPKRGRIPVAVEVIRRMKSLLRDDSLLTIGLSGTLALAAKLAPPAPHTGAAQEISASAIAIASAAVTPIATAFLEAGANVIFLLEDLLPAAENLSDWASHLATTLNIIRFYEALPVLLLNCGPETLPSILQLSLDCVVCPVARESLSPSLEKIEKPSPANFGIAISVSAGPGAPPRAEISTETLCRLVSESHPALITTSGDVPDAMDLKDLNKLRDALMA